MRSFYTRIFVVAIVSCLFIQGRAYAQTKPKANAKAPAKLTVDAAARIRIDKANNMYLKSFDTLNMAVNTAFNFWIRPGNSDTVKDKIGEVLYKLNKLFVTINGSKDYTIKVVNNDTKEQLSEEYDNYTALINRYVKTRQKDSALIAYEFIRRDLIVKMNRREAGLTGNMGLVSIKVSVLDTAGEEIPGYKVFAKPIMNLTKRSIQEFNPTANAIKSILPGFKEIWVEKDGKIVFKRTEEIKWKLEPTIYDFNVE